MGDSIPTTEVYGLAQIKTTLLAAQAEALQNAKRVIERTGGPCLVPQNLDSYEIIEGPVYAFLVNNKVQASFKAHVICKKP